jgi:adenine-specific DNA-methyltransferase
MSTKTINQIIRWAKGVESLVQPLDERDVPGTQDGERRLLRILGGIAYALAVDGDVDVSQWPSGIQEWMRSAPAPPPGLIEGILTALHEDPELLGTLYERVVSGANRRRLGTFFTPQPVLKYMLRLVNNGAPAPVTIADPGAGVGAFSAAALKQWPTATTHAVDINLVTLGLLAVHPQLATGGTARSHLHLHHEDFLGWLRTTLPETSGPRLIFGNPPYTRHQLLTADDKKKVIAAAGEWAPSGRSGLSTYFLAASLAALRDEDRLCLLLPINWLEADYARRVRDFLWREAKRPVEIHLFDDVVNVFHNAQVAAMILLVGPRTQAKSLVEVYKIKSSTGGSFKGKHEVRRVLEGPCPPAFTLAALRPPPSAKSFLSVRSVPLGDVATVRRGVATGANNFFLRKDDEIFGLPSHVLKPAIARLKNLEADDLTLQLLDDLGKQGERRWLLQLDRSDAIHPAVAELLAEAKKRELHLRYLCNVRPVWYAVEQIEVPDLVLSPMSKRIFRVVVNSVGAVPTNTLYGLRLRHRPAEPQALKALAGWLSSDEGQVALASVSRRHGDGLLKLEPRALLTVRIPSTLVPFLYPQNTEPNMLF